MRASALSGVAFVAMAAGAGLLTLAIACTESSGPPDVRPEREASCPSDRPTACPPSAPSFRTDVQPILVRRCWSCHADGGIAAAKHDFSTYDAVFAQRSSILNQVYACVMPPADAEQPTADERAKLLAWLVCHAPNN